jgi:hypothetical protein
LEQTDEAQADAGGFEAVTVLVGELVVNSEHGSVSFRDASDVTSTCAHPRVNASSMR